jgi:hypothetical protein
LFWLASPAATETHDEEWDVERKTGFRNESLMVLKNKDRSDEWEMMEPRGLSLREWRLVEGLKKGEFGKFESREGKLVLRREQKETSEKSPEESAQEESPKEESPKEGSFKEWEVIQTTMPHNLFILEIEERVHR